MRQITHHARSSRWASHNRACASLITRLAAKGVGPGTKLVWATALKKPAWEASVLVDVAGLVLHADAIQLPLKRSVLPEAEYEQLQARAEVFGLTLEWEGE